MGRILTTSQHRGAFRPRAGDSRASARLLLDEERADVGGDTPLVGGDLRVPTTGIAAQIELLAQLIGEREDAEALSRQLIASFGSLGRVIAARPQAIERLLGEPAISRRISAARDAVVAAQCESITRAVFDLRDARLQRYVVGLFQGLAAEELHAIFLDARNRYLTDERLAEGSFGHINGNRLALVSRAIDIGAAGVVLAHNHLSGEAEPSDLDVKETARLAQLLAELGLTLVDHLIVGGTTIYSMRGAGLL